jgi:hypothetical protein
MLNKEEKDRQKVELKSIEKLSFNLKQIINETSKNYLKELSAKNESLLFKFDDTLTIDSIRKQENTFEKLPASELLRRKLAGIPLHDDTEPIDLEIKRGNGKWKSINNYDDLLLLEAANPSNSSSNATINTLKTTYAHIETEEMTQLFFNKYKDSIKDNLDTINRAIETSKLKQTKWTQFWQDNILQIKNLYC